MKIASEFDVVIHLAARMDKSPTGANETFETNVKGTVNILKAMRKDAVFIFASTKDVYGRFADNFAEVPESCPTVYSGQSPLEWSKLIAERYVEYYAQSLGIRSCIYRLSNIYTPKTECNTSTFVEHYVEAINTGERLRLPAGGSPVRDLLHVNDFALACEAFISSIIRHGLYNVGGGRANAVSLRDLVTKLEEVSELEAVVDDDNPLPAPVPMNYVSDLSLISQELGWKPQISLIEGLRELF